MQCKAWCSIKFVVWSVQWVCTTCHDHNRMGRLLCITFTATNKPPMLNKHIWRLLKMKVVAKMEQHWVFSHSASLTHSICWKYYSFVATWNVNDTLLHSSKSSKQWFWMTGQLMQLLNKLKFDWTQLRRSDIKYYLFYLCNVQINCILTCTCIL